MTPTKFENSASVVVGNRAKSLSRPEACLAYLLDNVHTTLKNSRNIPRLQTVQCPVVRYRIQTRVFLPSETKAELIRYKADIRFILALHLHIPVLLLDPDEDAPLIQDHYDYSKVSLKKYPTPPKNEHRDLYRTNLIREPRISRTRYTVSVSIPPGPALISSPFCWLVHSLQREAISIPGGSAPSDFLSALSPPHTTLLAKYKQRFPSRKEILNIIRTRDYEKALKVWEKMVPILREEEGRSSAYSSSWWTGTSYKLRKGWGSNQYGSFSSNFPIGSQSSSSFESRVSSLDVFEEVVAKGGWRQFLSKYPREAWALDQKLTDFNRHAKLVRAWEHFVKCR